MNEIVMYTTEDEGTRIEVKFELDSVWLSQQQMAELFQQTKQNISLHINNCFKEGELDRAATVKESLTVQNEGLRQVKRKVDWYNLDVIISVGYRVKSRRGTQFRQWATNRLKEYLVQGYAINQRRLEEKNLELKQLKEGIGILHRAIAQEALSREDAGSISGLLDRFAAGLLLLDDYDHESLDTAGKTKREAIRIGADEYRALIGDMRKAFASAVFGVEKDKGFESAVSQIYQSFGGAELYPSLEEKAATLLYLVTKNHGFVDGNKRIAAVCFLYFLERNGMLEGADGKPAIDNDALAALTLFATVSWPGEMDTVKKVIISVLNRKGSA